MDDKELVETLLGAADSTVNIAMAFLLRMAAKRIEELNNASD